MFKKKKKASPDVKVSQTLEKSLTNIKQKDTKADSKPDDKNISSLKQSGIQNNPSEVLPKNPPTLSNKDQPLPNPPQSNTITNTSPPIATSSANQQMINTGVKNINDHYMQPEKPAHVDIPLVDLRRPMQNNQVKWDPYQEYQREVAYLKYNPRDEINDNYSVLSQELDSLDDIIPLDGTKRQEYGNVIKNNAIVNPFKVDNGIKELKKFDAFYINNVLQEAQSNIKHGPEFESMKRDFKKYGFKFQRKYEYQI